jgi:TolB protein
VSGDQIRWSKNGQSVIFIANESSGSKVYEATLDGATVVERSHAYAPVLAWQDGVSILWGQDNWTWYASDDLQNKLNPFGECQGSDRTYSFEQAPSGDSAIAVNCQNGDWRIYRANSMGTALNPLLDPPLHAPNGKIDFAWSPRGDQLAFNVSAAGKTDLYVLDVSESMRDPSIQPLTLTLGGGSDDYGIPSWQPVVKESVVKETPTPKPTETVSTGRLIAFTSLGENGSTDIYTVQEDGSVLVNLTNNAAQESSLAWSPDGRRLAFVSDQDGREAILVMDADGSNLATLTDAPGSYGWLLWSPAGTRLAYTLYDPDGKTANIYVMESNGQNPRRLTDRHPGPDNVGVAAEEWSPDGKYIYYSDYLAPGQSHIIKLDAESGGSTLMTAKMFDLPYYLTVNQDGSITYLANCTENWADFCLRAKSITPDGTGEELHETMQIQQVCSSKDRVSSFYFGAEWFPDRSKIVFAFHCFDGVHLYIANADGSGLRPLTSQPVFYKDLGLNKSSFELLPDGQSILFLAPLDINQTKALYAINVQDALNNPELRTTPLNISASQLSNLTWQPVLNNVTVKETPMPEPVEISSHDGLVAFEGGQNGNSEIYTMHADGSQLTDITNDPAGDYLPLWSPDGQKIAFISERTGNSDIFVMDPDGSNLTQLTDNPGYDGYFSWSPDGKKIAYLTGKGDINRVGQLGLMDADGGNKTTLTDPGDYLLLGWSPDSQKLVYLKQNTETGDPKDDLVVVMNTDGTNYHEWNFIVDRILWEDNQHFIGDGWNGQVESPDLGWSLHRFSTNGDPAVEVASNSNRIVEILKDTHVVAGASILAWYRSDGSPVPFTSWNSSEVCRGAGTQFMPANWTSTAPDESKALIVIPCQSGDTWFYVNTMDGLEIRKLTDFKLDATKKALEWRWSPNGKYGIMVLTNSDYSKADLYLFDVEKMLQDPSTLPIQLTTDEAVKMNVVWQPAP